MILASTKIGIIGANNRMIESISRTISPKNDLMLVSLSSDQVSDNFFAVLIPYESNSNSSDSLTNLLKIKANHPNIKVIMLGKNPCKKEIINAFRYGADDFLFFPLTPNTLFNSLNRLQEKKFKSSKISWWKHLWFTFFPKNSISTISSPNTLTHLPKIHQNLLTIESTKKAIPDLQVQFLGYFNIFIKGKKAPKFSGKKAKALLAYLLLKYPKPVHRDILINNFWGNSTNESARNCLNVTLHSLRKLMEEIIPKQNFIQYKEETYLINPNIIIERDIDLFDKLWKKGRQIEQQQGMSYAVDTFYKASEFLKGNFLEDFRYEEWVENEREKYHEKWLVILDCLSTYFLNQKKYKVCKNLCQQMLTKDPCLEEIHIRLIKCYIGLNMRDQAIRQFQKCKEIMKQELNIDPSPAALQMFSSIIN